MVNEYQLNYTGQEIDIKLGQIDNKLDKENPIGTGSLSINRLKGSIVGEHSSTLGEYNIASSYASHAEGVGTEASGILSHAEGDGTTASGSASHAEGVGTEASGSFSHAEGDSTTASGSASHAEGDGTIATGYCQHVQGKYNIKDINNDYAHIVGNGEYEAPSNAHTLDWDGNAWFAGNISAANIPEVVGNARIETGSYVGTGTSGSNYLNSLTFSGEPKIVFIYNGNTEAVLFRGASGVYFPGTSGFVPSWQVTWDGNIVKWYCSSTTGNYATSQFNTADATYTYYALI